MACQRLGLSGLIPIRLPVELIFPPGVCVGWGGSEVDDSGSLIKTKLSHELKTLLNPHVGNWPLF